MSRIAKRFAQLKADQRAGLVTYVTAGDPNLDVSYQILKGLPAAGADLIELGMPFTDPMADGPSIQLAGQRALKAGITVDATFDMVRRFRKETGDNDTPILLMGYYNLVYQRGPERFCKEAAAAGGPSRRMRRRTCIDWCTRQFRTLHLFVDANRIFNESRLSCTDR